MSDRMRLPTARDFPPGRLQLQKEHLVSELAVQQAPPARRRGLLLLVAVSALLLVASGFTTYVLTREPTHLDTIGCFATSSAEAGGVTDARADGRDPVAICAELWRQGVVGDVPVPTQLAACVLESGTIGVFPASGTDTCARLGLAVLPASYAVEVKRFVGLRDAIVGHLGAPATGSSLGSSKCVGEQAARTAVRRELDALGYRDWQIEIADIDGSGHFTAERPCAEAAFDSKRKVVTLVPVWRP